MKLFAYKVDVSKLKLDPDSAVLFEKTGQKAVFENTLIQGLANKHRDGLDGSRQRCLGRILEKLDITETEFLNLEEAEFDLVKAAFCGEGARFAPGQTRLIVQYLRAIDAAIASGDNVA